MLILLVESVKITEFFPSLRFAVSGLAGGPDLLPMLEIMGKDKVLSRLGKAIDLYAPETPKTL